MSEPDKTKARSSLQRWLPLIVLVSLMAIAFAMGWHKLISPKTIGLNYDRLHAFISDNILAALGLYVLVYIGVVSLSLPGATVLTVSAGLLFGWRLGAAAAVTGATIGATVIFLVARSSLGEVLAAKAGPWLDRLRAGFKENALSYLLFLRLVPAFPFVIVNLAAALLGVPLLTYVLGTAIGIIPGSLAFAFAGAGLRSVVEAQNAKYHACLAKGPANPETDCPYTIETGALVTKELLIAFVLLGIVALIPVALKKYQERRHVAL